MSSMKYPYRDLGVPFDRNFRNDLNANFDDIEHDIRMIGGEAAQQALEAADEANTQAIYAQTSGDYAQDKGDYAAQQGDYAKTQGDYAKTQGDAANLAATNANDAANNANSAAANADNAAATANNAADNANTAADNANDAATNANTAADNANTQATNAQNAAQSANDAATNANNAANNANTKATYAQQQGDYAKAQGDYAKQIADENKTRWLTAVNTYTDIATTYPNPQLGDTVQTIDDSKIYRWDGTQWVWTQQYNANAITDVQNKIGILTKRTDGFISVKEFGAKGDGVTDDTAAIQNAINYCSSNTVKLLFESGKTYCVGQLEVKDNLYIEGNGASLKCIITNVNYVLGTHSMTYDYNTPNFITVNNVIIQNLNINTNGNAVNGIFLSGRNIRIEKVYVYGLNNPSISYYGIRIQAGSSDVTINDCKIDLDLCVPFEKYSGLAGISTTGISVDSNGGLNTSTQIQPAIAVNTNIKITNNKVYGGTHGIGIIASEHCVIKNNDVSYSAHRGIVLSQNASYNEVKNNKITQFGSSGIHVNAGSNDNIISDNKIWSDGSFKPLQLTPNGGGESALQCYLKSKNNKFINNVVNTNSTNYAFYSAINCDGLVVDNNVLQGGFLAVLAIESDWLPRPLLSNQPYSRPNYASPQDITGNTDFVTWDNGDGFSNVTITNNTILRPTDDGWVNAGIYIAQIGSALLQNVTIVNNTINSIDSRTHDIYISVTDASKFVNNILSNNKINPLQTYKLYFENGIQFKDYSNNNWQAVMVGLTSISNNTLDIKLYDHYYLNSGSIVVNNIINPMVVPDTIRHIYIRLAIGAKIVNSSYIRLKSGADVTGVTGNEIIHLITLNGVFIQV